MELSRHKKRGIIILHDCIAIFVAWLCAYWLRINLSDIVGSTLNHSVETLPYLLVVQLFCSYYCGMYRGFWRFASMPDLLRIIKSVVLASLSLLVVLYFANKLQIVPRSIIPTYALLAIIFLGGSRFLYRWLRESKSLLKHGEKVLIVGAGSAGESLVRNLIKIKDGAHIPVCFADDDKSKQGREIHGIQVKGQINNIPELIKKHDISMLFIAMPTADSLKIREIYEYANSLNIPCRTSPGINDLADGKINLKDLREVSLEDLLGRDPIKLDWPKMQSGIKDKIVLVSGAGGSIGSELCRQIAKLKPSQIVLLDQSEFNLYSIEMELREKYQHLLIDAYLVDVFDVRSLEEVFASHAIDLVFHAAAYKHVPMLEYQAKIAVQNNVVGTQNIAKTAIKFNVKRFVLISTDKAVRPTNIMGATKRAAEMICQLYNKEGKTKFITVRFGNVLGSAGSVVPLFKRQLEAGGPLTVTDPNITRFFMTIPEASQLILQSAVAGKGGEIFVLDMGEPVKISFLAEQMIKLAGKTIDEVGIEYVGLRPGEKLYEELFYEDEKLINTEYEKLLLASHISIDLEKFSQLLTKAKELTGMPNASYVDLLAEIVPDYQRQVTTPQGVA